MWERPSFDLGLYLSSSTLGPQATETRQNLLAFGLWQARRTASLPVWSVAVAQTGYWRSTTCTPSTNRDVIASHCGSELRWRQPGHWVAGSLGLWGRGAEGGWNVAQAVNQLSVFISFTTNLYHLPVCLMCTHYICLLILVYTFITKITCGVLSTRPQIHRPDHRDGPPTPSTRFGPTRPQPNL